MPRPSRREAAIATKSDFLAYVVLGFIFCLSAFASTYYVSASTGSDSNTGSEQSAWQNGTNQDKHFLSEDYARVERPYGPYLDISTYEYEKDFIPTRVKNVQVSGDTITWKKIKTASSYTIKVMNNKGKKIRLIKKIKTNSYTFTNLKANKKYKIKIKAKRVRNSIIYFGPYSKIKSFTTGATSEFLMGGTISGLSGTVVLQNNATDDLTLTANGSFAFTTELKNGDTYDITVSKQPYGKYCTITNGSGTTNSADVTNVLVECVAKRGMYVDNFDTILGVSTKEDALFDFIVDNSITYLVLYDLHLLWSQQDDLNDFIGKAKNLYGIEEIAAAGENTPFFENVIAYNNTHANKFDVLNLEYEYWNNDPRDPDNYYDKLDDMQTLANANGLLVEAYIGWPTEAEMAGIVSRVDRLLIHAYVTTPVNAADYLNERLGWIDNEENLPIVWVIFSVEAEFMGPWIAANSIEEAEEIVMTGLEDNGQDLLIEAFHYFTYTKF